MLNRIFLNCCCDYLMLLYVFVGNAVVISFGLLSAGRFTLHIHHCYSFAFSHPPFHPRALVIFDIQSNTVHSVDNTRFIFTWEYYTDFFWLDYEMLPNQLFACIDLNHQEKNELWFQMILYLLTYI